MARLRVGLIGTGKHGSRYARHMCRELRDDVELVAIARRTPELLARQAAEFDCRAYSDYRELVAAPEVEAIVSVAVPTLSPQVCAAAAAAGKPLLLEKPAAPSVAAAREMLAKVRVASVPVMVAQTLRYNSVVRALRAARDEIGPIHALRLSQRFEPSPLSWIDNPAAAGGGIILHTGVHSFDLLRWLTGLEVERVSCELAGVVTAQTEDNFSAAIRMQGAVMASVAGSRATHSRSGPIEITGAGGMLQGDHVRGTAVMVSGTTVSDLPVASPAATVLEVLRDFVAAVADGRPMPIPLEEGLRGVAVAAACYRSAREGRSVAIEDIAA